MRKIHQHFTNTLVVVFAFVFLLPWLMPVQAADRANYNELVASLNQLREYRVSYADLQPGKTDRMSPAYQHAYDEVKSFQNFLIFLNDEVIRLRKSSVSVQQRGIQVEYVERLYTRRANYTRERFKDIRRGIDSRSFLAKELQKLMDRVRYVDQKLDDHSNLNQMSETIHFERDAWADYVKTFPWPKAVQSSSSAKRAQQKRDEFVHKHQRVVREYRYYMNAQKGHPQAWRLQRGWDRMHQQAQVVERQYNDFYHRYASKLDSRDPQTVREMQRALRDLDREISNLYHIGNKSLRDFYRHA